MQRRSVDKKTVFVRNSAGAVKGVEIKRTDGNFYIGPDGKVFMSEPSQEVINKLYCK